MIQQNSVLPRLGCSHVIRVCIFYMSMVLSLGGCDADTEKANEEIPKTYISEQRCDARLPGNGQEQIVPRPIEPATCALVLMICHACRYDESGQFTEEVTQICGVCIGWEL